MSDLNLLLKELNSWLVKNDIEIDLVIIGAYAVHLHSITTRTTLDVDTLTKITNPKVLSQINKIGEKHGLTSWLNNQAEGLMLPEGFFQRTITSNDLSNIIIKYASRADLIKLKVAAYYYRHEYELKDLDDLSALNLTQIEFSDGVEFLKTKHVPESEKFENKFLKDLSEVMSRLEELLFG